MSNKQFNQFKSFVNSSGMGRGKGLLPIFVGLGLLWLAKSSIYYGNEWLIFKLTLDITQSSSTSSLED